MFSVDAVNTSDVSGDVFIAESDEEVAAALTTTTTNKTTATTTRTAHIRPEERVGWWPTETTLTTRVLPMWLALGSVAS
jgi:hypothetical protein